MDTQTWNDLLEKQLDKTKRTLGVKADEYATEDRLHNFKVAAELQGITPRAALAGMMAKHTVSVYDILHADKLASNEMVQEKLGDNLNYLLLAFAVIQDERESLTVGIGDASNEWSSLSHRELRMISEIDRLLEDTKYRLITNYHGQGTAAIIRANEGAAMGDTPVTYDTIKEALIHACTMTNTSLNEIMNRLG